MKTDTEDLSGEALYEILMLLPPHHNPIRPGKERPKSRREIDREKGGGGRGYWQMEWRRKGGRESIENIAFCRGERKSQTSLYTLYTLNTF